MPAFVDAKILVYAEDRDAGSKHTIARDLVADLWRSGEGVPVSGASHFVDLLWGKTSQVDGSAGSA